MQEIILIYSDIPGLWSGTGEVIMVEERGLSFVGIAEEQNTTEMIGMTDND